MSHETYKHNIVMSNYSTHTKYYKEFAVVARQEVDISFRYLWTVRKIKKMGRNIPFFFSLIVWFERIWKKRNLFSIALNVVFTGQCGMAGQFKSADTATPRHWYMIGPLNPLITSLHLPPKSAPCFLLPLLHLYSHK